MTQKIINVGTVANDGTGDTIRGAFTNVNANFTEVYNNVATLTAGLASIDSGQNTAIQAAYVTSNAAFAQANSANSLAYNVSINANLFSTSIGSASNAYANYVGASANAYAASLSGMENNYIIAVGTAGNNYASILSANNAAGANAWTNTVSVVITDWANAKFDTVTSTTAIFTTANAAFARANNSIPNTTATLVGNFTATGSVIDGIGPVREKTANTTSGNIVLQAAESIVIANNSNTIYINVDNDGNFLLTANTGATVEIYQYGSGTTAIRPRDASVTIYSANNWANIAGQYLTASLVKIKANTWMLTGNLKA